MLTLLLGAVLMVLLFAVSGVWTVAGVVFVLGVAVMVMVGIVQAVVGAWPRSWWPRQRCSQCGRRGHAVWESHAKQSPTSPGPATFNRHDCDGTALHDAA
jgi:hypothetical protein